MVIKTQPKAGKKNTIGKPKAKSEAAPPPEPKHPAAQTAKPGSKSNRGKPGRAPGGPQIGGNKPKLEIAGAAKVIEALRLSGGIKAAAAGELGVSRTTLYKFIDDYPEVGEALSEIDSEILDVAEAQVVKAIKTGEMQTVRWYLELKGKDRGYVRRVETTGKDGGPVETQQKLDLSKLTDEELEILTKAAERRENDVNQG